MRSVTRRRSRSAPCSRCSVVSRWSGSWTAISSHRASRSPGARRALLNHRGLRQLNIERGALARTALRPDPPADPLDRFAYQREADAGAGILIVAMQALKDLEDVIVVFHLEADAVVGDAEHHAEIVAVRMDLDVRMRTLACVLQRVLEQVAQRQQQAFRIDTQA